MRNKSHYINLSRHFGLSVKAVSFLTRNKYDKNFISSRQSDDLHLKLIKHALFIEDPWKGRIVSTKCSSAPLVSHHIYSSGLVLNQKPAEPFSALHWTEVSTHWWSQAVTALLKTHHYSTLCLMLDHKSAHQLSPNGQKITSSPVCVIVAPCCHKAVSVTLNI